MPRRATLAAALLPLGLVAGLVAAPAQAATLAPAGSGSGAAEEVTTTAEVTTPDEVPETQSRVSGKRVEVTEARTETTTTYANPDGTYTTETSAGPIRFRDGGQWRDIDLDLAAEPGGSGLVEPAAHPLQLTLSPGASQDGAALTELVTMTDAGDDSIAVQWPGDLPAPQLDGNVATYVNVQDGVDLVVEVTRTGFEQYLVLHERPSLEEVAELPLAMPLTTTGLETAKAPDGTIVITDGGEQVGEVPAPLMWDATSGVAADSLPSGDVQTVDHETELTTDGALLTMTPDADYLLDPSTTYPVTIDPAVSWSPTYDAALHEKWTTDHSSTTYLRLGADENGRMRSLLNFDSAAIKGKHILSAKLNLFEHYAATCASKPWEVWHTGGANTSTRWSNQPGWYTKYATSSMTKGASSSCAAGWVNADVTDLVQMYADASSQAVWAGLRASDETDRLAYKSFNSGDAASNVPYISMTYNSLPGQPVGRSVTPCGSGCSNPLVTSSGTPALTGNTGDADGGTLRYDFEVWHGHSSSPTTRAARGSVSQAVGKTAAWKPGAALADGPYVYRVRAFDGVDYGAWSSGFVPFTVDTTAPAAATVSSTAYPANGRFNGATGTRGTFAITVAAGQGAKTLTYWFDDGSRTNVAAANTTVSWTPTTTGAHTLNVITTDAAGNASSTTQYRFLVGNTRGVISSTLAAQVAEEYFSSQISTPTPDVSDEVLETNNDPIPEIDEPPSPYDGVTEEYRPEYDEQQTVSAFTVNETGPALPQDSAGAIVAETSGGQVTFDLPGGERATTPTPAGADALIYANTGVDSDIVARRDGDGSVKTFQLLRSSDAPRSYPYNVTLAAGQTLQSDDGVIAIVNPDGSAAGLLSAPFAVDASGADVPVTLSAGPDGVVVAVPADLSSYQFPILIDPTFYVPGQGDVKVTGAEAKYCALHAKACQTAFKDANTALGEAQKRFKGQKLYLDRGDAFRHCYWNARMYINLGLDKSKAIATAHESDDSGVSTEMDLKNNIIGRAVGKDMKTMTKARDKCLTEANAGRLWIVNKSNKVVKG